MLSRLLHLSRLGRTIPLAVICSMVTVTVFYVLVNVAYYTMMSPAELLLSDAVAVVSALPDQSQVLRNKVLFFNAGPCYPQTFANRALQGLASLIPILVALSCLGALNGGFFGSPR